MPNDLELMMEVRNGDLDKLGILFEKHNRSLFTFFLKQTSDPHTSEDLVQEVFMRILKYRKTFRGDSKFTTWMFRIALNAKVDHYRKHKHQDHEIELYESIESDDPGPEHLLDQKDERSLLMKALGKLDEDKREVLLLSRFQGLKYKDIAAILECKVGTVKARVHWALKELTYEYNKLAGSDVS